MKRFRGLLILAGVLVAIVAVFYLALPLRVPVERPVAYWQIDDHTLGILVGGGYQIGCSVVSVDEESDPIRIDAQCFDRLIPAPNAAMLQPYVMQVSLVDPLGERKVVDGLGDPAQVCPSQAECNIPG